MKCRSILEKLRSVLLGERVLQSVQITQQFPLYGILPETYTLDFIDNSFGFRSMKISSSNFCGERKLWIGTEIYVLTIAPWMNYEISNEALKSHLDILKGLADFIIQEEEQDQKHVIQLNRYIKKKKKRPDKF
jgi:hypothetical protein